MKKIYIFAAATLCGLTMMTSCTKEDVNGISDGALEIFAEGTGTKTTVNGSSVKWVENDEVWINGINGTVKQSGGHWYADGTFSTSADFNAFYPATLATAAAAGNQTSATATVVFPSRYASSFDGNSQVIALPMGARCEGSATSVVFKHLSAGINVNVENNTGDILLVDSVSVTSATVNLCGQVTVTLSADADPAAITAGNGTKTVTVYFASPVSLAANDSKTIQVPVIPNATSLGDLTVNVYSHTTLPSSSIQSLIYTNQKSNTPALVRNAVASLPVNMTTDGTEMTKRVLGAFSVSDNMKVYFSMGNLQYKEGERFPWRFALNQYDCVGAWNTADWVDYFGWGTWTGNNVDPLRTPYDATRYLWNTEDFVKESELADASQRGFDWRTLSSKEWEYIINVKGTNGRKDDYRFAKAIVSDNKISGLILFPDDFVLPTGVTINSYNKSSDHFSSNILSDAEWSLLEAEGCVFLPAAGCRKEDVSQEVDKMGGYHSSTEKPATDDYKMRFDNTSLVPAKNGGKMWGNSVRLVRDVK